MMHLGQGRAARARVRKVRRATGTGARPVADRHSPDGAIVPGRRPRCKEIPGAAGSWRKEKPPAMSKPGAAG
jgi:hypothetical protein